MRFINKVIWKLLNKWSKKYNASSDYYGMVLKPKETLIDSNYMCSFSYTNMSDKDMIVKYPLFKYKN